MDDKQDHFNTLRKIQHKPNSTQRELAEELGFSLGKLNYCLKALKAKGLVKISNFKKNPNKINYIYVLTPRGIAEKSELTINFIDYCKKNQDLDGYIKQSFFEFQNMKRGMFLSGPFTNMIFNVIANQRNKLKILIGKVTTTITKNSNYLFRPV